MLTFSSIYLSLGHIASGKTYLIETVDKKHQQTKMSQNNGNSDYSDIRHDVPSDRNRKHVDSKRSKSKRTEQKRNRMFETGNKFTTSIFCASIAFPFCVSLVLLQRLCM